MGVIKRLWKWMGKKVVISAVSMSLLALKAWKPDWPIPSEEFVRDVLIGLLSAHTLTDIVAIFKTGGKELLEGRAK